MESSKEYKHFYVMAYGVKHVSLAIVYDDNSTKCST